MLNFSKAYIYMCTSVEHVHFKFRVQVLQLITYVLFVIGWRVGVVKVEYGWGEIWTSLGLPFLFI